MSCLYTYKGKEYTEQEILDKFNSPVERINSARQWLLTNVNMNPEELSIISAAVDKTSLDSIFKDNQNISESLSPESVDYQQSFNKILSLIATDAERIKMIKDFNSEKGAAKEIERLDKVYNSEDKVKLRDGKVLTTEDLIEAKIAEDYHEFKISNGTVEVETPEKQTLFKTIFDFNNKVVVLQPRLKDISFAGNFYQRLQDGNFRETNNLSSKIESYRDNEMQFSMPGLTDEQSMDMVYGIHNNFVDVLFEKNKFYDILDGKEDIYDEIFNEALKRTAKEGDRAFTSKYIARAELLKVRHKALLNEYNIYTGEDVEDYYDLFFSDEKTKDTEFNKNSIEFDPKVSMRKAIRILLTAIPGYQKNSVGTNVLVPIKEVNGALLNNLTNTPPHIDEFLYTLERLTNTKPYLQKVLDILQKEKDNTRFVGDFISSFNNTYTNFDIITDLNGELRVISSNQQNIRNQIVGSWKAELENNINTSLDLIADLLKIKISDPIKAIEFFNKLGVNITKAYSNIAEEAERIQNVIERLSKANSITPESLTKIFDTEDKIFTYTEDKTSNNLSYIFSSIVEREARQRDDLDIMVRNAEGKPIYPVTQYHYLSMTIGWLNYYRDKFFYDKSTRDEYSTLDNYLKTKLPFLFNYNSSTSYILEDFVNNTRDFTFGLFSGFDISKTQAKTDFGNTSDFDYYTTSVKLFGEGKVLSITQGDRKIFPVFGGMRILSDEDLLPVYKGYIKSELIRMHNSTNPALNFDKIVGLDNTKSTLDSEIVNVDNLYKQVKSELEGKTSDEAADIIDDFLDGKNTEIDLGVRNFIDVQTKNYLNKFEDLKILQNIEGLLTSPYVNRGNYKSIKDLTRAWFTNVYFANIEQIKLLYGDLSLFKKYAEFWKRLNTPTSTGTPGIVSDNLLQRLDDLDDFSEVNGFNYADARRENGVTQNTIKEQFLKDNEVESHYFETIRSKVEQGYRDLYSIFPWEDRFKSIFGDETPNLEQLIKYDTDKHVKGFLNINEADGFSYINLFEWRRVMSVLSLWTPKHDELFNTELAVLKIAMDDTLTKEQKQSQFNAVFSNMGKSVDGFFNRIEQASLLKPQYAGPVYNMPYDQYEQLSDLDRANIYGIRKTSFMPLLPSVIFGTNLETMHHKMLRSGTGITFYESAAKIGRSNILHDVNEIVKTKENEFETLGGAFSTYIDYSYLKNQLFISPEEKQEIIDSTQSRNTIIADKYHQGVPMDYILKNKGTSFTEIKRNWENLDENQKLEQSDIQKSVKEYNELTSKVLTIRREQLLEELDIAVVNPNLTDFDVKSIKNVIQVLKDQALDRKSTIDVLDSFNYMLNNSSTLFNVFPNINQLQSIITSLVTNNAIKIKRAGSDYAQVSPTMFEEKGTERTEGLSDKGVLNTYEIDDTLKASEIIIPASKDMLRGIEKIIKDGKNKKVMEAYNEIKGNYPAGFNIKLLVDVLNKLIENGYLDSEVTYKGLRIPNQELSSNDVMKVKRFAIPTMSKFAIVNAELIAKTGSDFDIDKLNLYFKYLDEDLKEIKYEEGTNNEDAIFNRLSEIEQKLILNPSNINNLMHPVEDAGLKDLLVNKIEKLQDQEDRYSTKEAKNLSQVFLPENNLQKKNDASQAAIGIGQIANNVMHHTKARNTVIADELLVAFGKDLIALPTQIQFLGYEDNNDVNSLFTNDLESIPQLGSGLLTTQVDLQKDPYATYMNITAYSNPVINYLLRRGVNKDVVFAFMTQPAILEFLEKRSLFFSPTYKFKSRSRKSPDRLALESMTKTIGLGVKKSQAGDVKKINPKDLFNSKFRKDKEFQKNVLLYFISLNEQSKQFNNFRILMSADTKHHKSLNSYKEQIKMYDDLKQSGFIVNLDTMLDTGFIAPFIKNAKLYYYPWKSLFLSTRDFGSHVGLYIDAYSEAIADSMGMAKNDERRVTLANSMERQFLEFIYDNYYAKSLPRVDMTDKLLYAAKQIKSVDLLKIFSPIRDYGVKKKANIIQGKVKTLANFELNNYINILKKIYATKDIPVSPTEFMSGKDFITQLYIQNLKQTKNDFSPFDISNVLPGNMKTEILANILGEFLQMERSTKIDEMFKNFAREFQLNNARYVSYDKTSGLLYREYDKDLEGKSTLLLKDDQDNVYEQKGYPYTSDFNVASSLPASNASREDFIGEDEEFEEIPEYALGAQSMEDSNVKDVLTLKLKEVAKKIQSSKTVKFVNGELKNVFNSDNASKDLVDGRRTYINFEKLLFSEDGKVSLKEQVIENEGYEQKIPETQIGTYTLEGKNFNVKLMSDAIQEIASKRQIVSKKTTEPTPIAKKAKAEIPTAVQARIILVDEFGVPQQQVDRMTSDKVIEMYTEKIVTQPVSITTEKENKPEGLPAINRTNKTC